MAIFDPNIFDRNIFDTPPLVEDIRNFSLKSWRRWIKDEDEEELLEQGILPVELKEQADQAVIQSVNASSKISQGDERLLLLKAMEARMAYEEAYRKAYKEGYIEEVVNELWASEISRIRHNRAVSILLLH